MTNSSGTFNALARRSACFSTSKCCPFIRLVHTKQMRCIASACSSFSTLRDIIDAVPDNFKLSSNQYRDTTFQNIHVHYIFTQFNSVTHSSIHHIRQMDSLNIGVGKRGRCDNSRVKGPIQCKHYVIFASPPDLKYVMHLQQSQR